MPDVLSLYTFPSTLKNTDNSFILTQYMSPIWLEDFSYNRIYCKYTF